MKCDKCSAARQIVRPVLSSVWPSSCFTPSSSMVMSVDASLNSYVNTSSRSMLPYKSLIESTTSSCIPPKHITITITAQNNNDQQESGNTITYIGRHISTRLLCQLSQHCQCLWREGQLFILCLHFPQP